MNPVYLVLPDPGKTFASADLARSQAERLAAEHPQPTWCRYPDAVAGVMGCWSLMDHKVDSEDRCKGCDCYRAER